MSKRVSVTTIRNLVKENKAFDYETIDCNGIEIEVKKCLPMDRKRMIVEMTVGNAFVRDEDRTQRFDKGIKESIFNYFIAKEYTNLNMMDDPFEMYDALFSTGIMKAIKASIMPEERKLLEDMLDDRINEEFRLQELKSNLGYKIDVVLEEINKKLQEGIEVLANFDSDKLEMLTSFMDVDDNKETDFNKAAKDKVKSSAKKNIIGEALDSVIEKLDEKEEK